MNPRSGRTGLLAGIVVGLVALITVLATTGPNPDIEFTGNIRRQGGPCLRLEQWGLFGWVTIGQTQSMTQTTNGDWREPTDESQCQDVDDSLIMVRMPLNAAPDSYRICGLADDRACITARLVPFQSTTPGP